MLNKIVLALGVLVVISALGGALQCNFCMYSSEMPESEQKCTDKLVNCTTGYCLTAIFNNTAGKMLAVRHCDSSEAKKKLCPAAKGQKKCDAEIQWKSCLVECCTTDNCNNYTPPSQGATGVMATKFAVFWMFFICLLFA